MKKIIITTLVVSLLVLNAGPVLALTIEKNPTVSVEKNFLVGPAKIEKDIVPGDTKTISIVVENRTGKTQGFEISFEDFVGTRNGESPIKLLGDQKSETSLRDSLFVEKKEFVLDHGDRATIPVSISIPSNAHPGGKFAAIIVSAVVKNNSLTATERAYTGAVIVGRIASLVFVDVSGNAKKEGELVNFSTKQGKKVFFSNEIPFRLVFENKGEVNLNPYGIVEVKNMFGATVAKKILDPWYALPDSLRTRDVSIEKSKFFGFYRATAQVNRGYGDIVDERIFSFFVIPPVSLAGITLVVIVLVVAVTRFVKRKKNFYE